MLSSFSPSRSHLSPCLFLHVILSLYLSRSPILSSTLSSHFPSRSLFLSLPPLLSLLHYFVSLSTPRSCLSLVFSYFSLLSLFHILLHSLPQTLLPLICNSDSLLSLSFMLSSLFSLSSTLFSLFFHALLSSLSRPKSRLSTLSLPHPRHTLSPSR